ncbi:MULTISPECIES: hypothetical protein [Corynebacterium]|uniref:hypothetical protein n=1 Tax=Corynebacterium TaxID=1716 RepID=UPI0019574C79|nr:MULTISPECIES: hypothetical protein [Corynebacterium]MDN8624461.1 hypothetical protein [Corynebacterium kroppenstedtii]QRQ65274.1 hypothetical protein I6J23_01975 [Corynebacterium kroppenstedtii]
MSDFDDWDREGVEYDPESLAAVDRYLDNLPRVTDSDDDLGRLFIQARQEAERNIPATPQLSDLGFFDSFSEEETLDNSPVANAPTTVFHPVHAEGHTAASGDGIARRSDDADATVHDFAAWKNQREAAGDDAVAKRSRSGRPRHRSWRHGDNHNPVPRWMYALGGAAASCVLLAGGGAVIHASTPGSPLWGLNQRFFGDHAAAVELASTLDQVREKQEAGDVQGAAVLLEKAREVAHKAKDSGAKNSKKDESTTTVTVTDQSVVKGPDGKPTTVEKTMNNGEPKKAEPRKNPTTTNDRDAKEPKTTTETSTVTVTVTTTVTPAPVPGSNGSTSGSSSSGSGSSSRGSSSDGTSDDVTESPSSGGASTSDEE